MEVLSRVLRCYITWPVGSGFLGVEFRSQRCARLELSFRKLGQVRHDRVFIHVGVDDLLRGDDLRSRGRKMGA